MRTPPPPQLPDPREVPPTLEEQMAAQARLREAWLKRQKPGDEPGGSGGSGGVVGCLAVGMVVILSLWAIIGLIGGYIAWAQWLF